MSHIVLHRLRRLPEEAAAVAKAVAVLGDGAQLPLVAATAELGEEAVASATAALARADILRPDPPLGFVHPLVRDAIYHDLAPAERELGHTRAARLLREAGAPTDAVATQLLACPRRGEQWVVDVLVEAAASARASGAPDGAVACLERALEEPPAPGRSMRVLGTLEHERGIDRLRHAADHLVRTDPYHEPDLFWALRGGGGNSGVVTAIEFAVYPVRELYAGALFFPFEQASDVLHAWRELLPVLPEELMSWANLLQFPDLPVVSDSVRGGSFAVVMAAFLGDEADGRELLHPLRALGPAMDSFAMSPPIALAELAMDPPDPLPILSGHVLVEHLPATAVDDVVTAAGPGSGSPLAMMQLRHMGGALGRKAPGSGARATLPGEVSMFSLGIAPEEESGAAVRATLEAVEGALRAYRAGEYPNFVEEPADASAFFDRDTWARLREVKALYDSNDMFRGNHHVPPAASAELAA